MTSEDKMRRNVLDGVEMVTGTLSIKQLYELNDVTQLELDPRGLEFYSQVETLFVKRMISHPIMHDEAKRALERVVLRRIGP